MKTCPECPWSRAVKPGALGGSSPGKYVGQSIGPFVLPCHLHCDFDDPEWKGKIIDTQQCRGAAIFRANIGIAESLPPILMRQPADREVVFADHAEFVAHHTGGTVANARAVLAVVTPKDFLKVELGRNEVKLFPTAKGDK